jgi:flagellar biosynthesis protein FlhF
MRLASAALGPDAVILHTGQVEGSSLIEVVAAVDRAAEIPNCKSQIANAGYTHSDKADVWDRSGRRAGNVPNTQHPTPNTLSLNEIGSLQRQIAELRAQMPLSAGPVGAQADMATLPAGRLFAGNSNPSAWRTSAEMERRLREQAQVRTIEMRPGVCAVVALVGPTGVGKTTTAAKLAAAARLGENKRVAFINLDTYRVGASAQVETYARLLDCPMLTAHTPEELWSARRQFSDCDLVLIDTTGRSPRNTEEITAQAKILEAGNPDEVHLLLDTRNSPEVHRSVLRGYSFHRPTHICFCKVDELVPARQFNPAEGLSAVLHEALESTLPFSYVTTGQRLPEDVAPASIDNLMACYWGSF